MKALTKINVQDFKNMTTYDEFKDRFKLLASKNKHLVVNTLSNIFTSALIGNKTK